MPSDNSKPLLQIVVTLIDKAFKIKTIGISNISLLIFCHQGIICAMLEFQGYSAYGFSD